MAHISVGLSVNRKIEEILLGEFQYIQLHHQWKQKLGKIEQKCCLCLGRTGGNNLQAAKLERCESDYGAKAKE